MRQTLSMVGWVLLLSFLYGSTMVASRFSVGQYDPRTYISLRLLLASGIHIAVYLFSKQREWPKDKKLWLYSIGLGIGGTLIPMTAMVSSLQYQSTGVTAMLITLTPAMTVLMAHFFLEDEFLSWRKAIGVIVALCGAALLLVRGETGLAELAQADWRGYAWALSGMIAGAASGIYARRYLRHADAWDVTSIRMFSAAATLSTITYFTVGYEMDNVNLMGYGALLYATLTGTFLAMWLSFYIIKRYSATAAAQTSYAVPVISTTLGAFLLNEQVTSGMLVGMAIIVVGIALINWQPRQLGQYSRRMKSAGVLGN